MPIYDCEALREDVAKALAMLLAPGFDNDGGPASIADEVESLLSIETFLGDMWAAEHARFARAVFALKKAVATIETTRGKSWQRIAKNLKADIEALEGGDNERKNSDVR